MHDPKNKIGDCSDVQIKAHPFLFD